MVSIPKSECHTVASLDTMSNISDWTWSIASYDERTEHSETRDDENVKLSSEQLTSSQKVRLGNDNNKERKPSRSKLALQECRRLLQETQLRHGSKLDEKHSDQIEARVDTSGVLDREGSDLKHSTGATPFEFDLEESGLDKAKSLVLTVCHEQQEVASISMLPANNQNQDVGKTETLRSPFYTIVADDYSCSGVSGVTGVTGISNDTPHSRLSSNVTSNKQFSRNSARNKTPRRKNTTNENARDSSKPKTNAEVYQNALYRRLSSQDTVASSKMKPVPLFGKKLSPYEKKKKAEAKSRRTQRSMSCPRSRLLENKDSNSHDDQNSNSNDQKSIYDRLMARGSRASLQKKMLAARTTDNKPFSECAGNVPLRQQMLPPSELKNKATEIKSKIPRRSVSVPRGGRSLEGKDNICNSGQNRDLYERLISRGNKASLRKQMLVARAKHPSEHKTFSEGAKNALLRKFDGGSTSMRL